MANVRVDGIAVVLGPLLRDPRIRAAALVDVDSGMVLDAWSAAGGPPTGGPDPVGPAPDLELIGAQHAEVVRCALALLAAWPRTGGREAAGAEAGTCEVVLGPDGGCHHLLRTVPDPYGDRLALAVVVDGPARVLDRVRKQLRAVAVDALTAGPSMTRRPVRGAWSFATPGPDVPAADLRASPDPTAPGTPEARPPVRPAASVNAAPVRHPVDGLRHPVDGLRLPAPRNGPPGSPPVAAPPRPAPVDAATFPYLRPVPPSSVPPARTPAPAGRAPAAGAAAGAVADGVRPRLDPGRPPSPPAALPAPAPRQP